MELGLVGLPMSGKTTIFNALTGADRPVGIGASGRLDVQIAVVDVPDPRLDALHALFADKHKVHAQITFADVGGLTKGIGEGGLSGPFRNQLAQMDGFLHIIRVFENPNVPHPEGTVDPQRDLVILDEEFLLVDLIAVESRIARLKDEMSKGKDREVNARELALFERLHAHLEAGRPLRDLDLTPDDQFGLKGYGLLTLKPRLVLLNMGDEIVEVEGFLPGTLVIQGALETEIAQLDPEEAAIFAEEYGITEPMRERGIRASYALLDVQTFFTIGDEEVRAWMCPVGAVAQEAAGRIHTDLQRGFIRAEIIPVETLIELGGLAEARQAGKLRLEGRDYVMQDGDVMQVRFKV